MKTHCFHQEIKMLVSRAFPVALWLLAVFTPVADIRAAVYLMDFNTTEAGTYPGGAAAWNAYTAPSELNGGALKDSAGSTAAGLTLAVAGTITDSGLSGSAVFSNPSGGPSWVTTNGSLSNTAAAADYFFTSTNPGIDSFTLTFGGLTAGQTVSLDLFVSRADPGATGYYTYSLDGGSSWLGFSVLNKDGSAALTDGWNTHTTQTQAYNPSTQGNDLARYLNAGNLVLTGNTLQVRVTDGGGASSYAVLNAIQLTVVPEPSTAILMAAGLGLAALRRKHSGRP